MLGIEPSYLDFNSPALAQFNMTPETGPAMIRNGLQKDVEHLISLGYDASIYGLIWVRLQVK